MNTNDENRTAVDVIRCVYLARMASRKGHDEAARRWQAKAERWLQSQSPLTQPEDKQASGSLIRGL
jgi:hypothetical protein